MGKDGPLTVRASKRIAPATRVLLKTGSNVQRKVAKRTEKRKVQRLARISHTGAKVARFIASLLGFKASVSKYRLSLATFHFAALARSLR